MQHFTEEGEVDAQEEKEREGTARIHRGPEGGVVSSGRRNTCEKPEDKT